MGCFQNAGRMKDFIEEFRQTRQWMLKSEPFFGLLERERESYCMRSGLQASQFLFGRKGESGNEVCEATLDPF